MTEVIGIIRPRLQAAPAAEYASLWAELHHRPAIAPDLAGEPAWLAAWTARVPSYACHCRAHWREILDQLRPDYSGREAYFAWTIAAHNAVNRHLGRREWSVEEAAQFYGGGGAIKSTSKLV